MEEKSKNTQKPAKNAQKSAKAAAKKTEIVSKTTKNSKLREDKRIQKMQKQKLKKSQSKFPFWAFMTFLFAPIFWTK